MFSPARLLKTAAGTASVSRRTPILRRFLESAPEIPSADQPEASNARRKPIWATESRTSAPRQAWRPFENKSFFRPFELARSGRRPEKRLRPPRDPYPTDTSQLRYKDPFKQLRIDPRRECENAKLMSEFVTTMGKIKSRGETKLTMKSQRLLAKAIKRAKFMGIIPLHSKRGWIARATYNPLQQRRNGRKGR